MSSEPFVSFKYANVEDCLEELGLSDQQIKDVKEEPRNRFQRWVLAGQNNVEGAIAKLNPGTRIEKNTPAFTYARNAVINWFLYKKRAKDGSKTKDDAKEDYKLNIEYLKNVLQSDRGTRVKMVSILGPSQKNPNILLPSQLDTAFYGEANIGRTTSDINDDD